MSTTAAAILATMESPDLGGGNTNLVEVLAQLAGSTQSIANTITPVAAPGTDETGGTVCSLTEAVMGNTAGLVQIAHAISDLAEAVREHGGPTV
jgi:hypothetical protein